MSRRPPSLRNVRYYEQQHDRQLQSMSPGAMKGMLASAQPINTGSRAQSLFGSDAGAGAATSALLFWRDHWTLTADGAQDETLTYVPIDNSPHVYLNGVYQEETVDYTLSGRDLSVLTAMGALTDDILEVRYAYYEGTSSPIEDIPPLDVPFSSTGWRYTHDDPGPGWEQPDFDDSGWSTGQMPIGNTAYSAYADDDPNTVVPSTMNPVPNEIWVRRKLGPGTTIIFSYRMAKYLQVYVDGTLYTSQTFGGYHTATDLFPRIPDQTGIWTLAATVYDFSWVGAGPDFDIGINLEISGDEA